jgi:hypothetical protein
MKRILFTTVAAVMFATPSIAKPLVFHYARANAKGLIMRSRLTFSRLTRIEASSRCKSSDQF